MRKSDTYDGPARVGEIRPSQAIHSYGVGALVDLPNFSVMVGGLDRWDTSRQETITEDRLLGAVRTLLGPQVEALRALPVEERTSDNPFDDWARVGIPVTVFPRWLRCKRCNRLFPVASGALKFDHRPWRPDKTQFVHVNCDRAKQPPPAVPARFVAGCANGHLDEFPWILFAHSDRPPCANPIIQINDIGSGGRATDVLVKCLNCTAKGSSLARAFGPAAVDTMPQCRGRHPHLGVATEQCNEQLRTLVLGASNLWFNSRLAALSLPVEGGSLAQVVYDHWAALAEMPTKEVLVYALKTNKVLQGAFAGYDADEIWDGVEAYRAGAKPVPDADVFGPEWAALATGSQGQSSTHFDAEPIAAPTQLRGKVAGVTLAHRLRVVTALCGFTRISAGEPGEPQTIAPLEKNGAPSWVPVVENRGEGIFLQLEETAVLAWEAAAFDAEPFVLLRRAHRDWRETRGLDPTEGWPGERYVLLHSLSHALINELAIECGYSSASISERIYSRRPGMGLDPMAGILLYTSAPDADGTLGGLVNLGQGDQLGEIVDQALDRSGLCSSDPLCADHEPDAAISALHGAACHACLLIAETSCERGNRYLDRTLLVDTFRHAGLEFFD